jgi:hypothetical protein
MHKALHKSRGVENDERCAKRFALANSRIETAGLPAPRSGARDRARCIRTKVSSLTYAATRRSLRRRRVIDCSHVNELLAIPRQMANHVRCEDAAKRSYEFVFRGRHDCRKSAPTLRPRGDRTMRVAPPVTDERYSRAQSAWRSDLEEVGEASG